MTVYEILLTTKSFYIYYFFLWQKDKKKLFYITINVILSYCNKQIFTVELCGNRFFKNVPANYLNDQVFLNCFSDI